MGKLNWHTNTVNCLCILLVLVVDRSAIDPFIQPQTNLVCLFLSDLITAIIRFSNTASQILQSYDIDFHTIDVLSDEAIRQGIKDYSQWPTIPQLYVAG